MIKRIQIGFLLLLSTLLASCIQVQELENIGIINAMGVDSKENDSIETTLVVFQFSEQADTIAQLINGEGKTINGATEDAEHAYVSRLVPGKLKLMVFGEESAEKGILPYLDAQARDPRVPDLMYLAIGKPTAKEILTVDEKDISTDVGQFLYSLIENHSTDHNIPRKSLQDFLRIYYDTGQDNVLPIFEVKEKIPKQVGVALFKGDQMVGELTNDEIVLINLMDRHVKDATLELTLPIEPLKDFLEKREQQHDRNNLDIAFVINSGKSRTKIIDIEKPTFETNTKIKLRLMEQSAGVKLSDPKAVQTLETEIKKELEDRFNKLLKKLKEYESDPFGYGRYYHRTRKGQDLTVEEWREKYPNIEVKFNVDVEIIRHGAIS